MIAIDFLMGLERWADKLATLTRHFEMEAADSEAGKLAELLKVQAEALGNLTAGRLNQERNRLQAILDDELDGPREDAARLALGEFTDAMWLMGER